MVPDPTNSVWEGADPKMEEFTLRLQRHTDAHTLLLTHIQIYGDSHAHTYSHTHIMHIQAHSYIYTLILKHSLSHTHTYAHTHIHSHTCMLTLIY